MVLALAAALGCGGSKSTPDPVTPAEVPAKPAGSLYERLGGLEAIKAVTHQFVLNVVADKRINHFFMNSKADELEKKLVEQICQATGGPCTYTGKDMVTVHTGMKITDADFDALVEDLVAALDQFKVGQAEKDELLGALGAMRKDIVGK